jgi:hypothetical protein
MTGGRADSMKPSDFDTAALKEGTRHEMEHTNDSSKAREIAMDHLAEDPDYYKKLKDIEKYDRVEVEADGKKKLDYGTEDLEKKPDLKKTWSKLKKALSSDEAIMEITSQEFNPEDEQSDESPGQEPTENEEDGSGEQDEEAPQPEADEEQDEGAVDPAGEDGGELEEGADDLDELSGLLRDEGYSDAEIAYIVHNHMMPQSTVDDIKMDGQKAKNSGDQESSNHDLEHKRRMNDLEYEQAKKDGESDMDSSHAQRMNDLEYDTAAQEQDTNTLDRDHKRRMLDLEYEAAKKERDMELEYKQKELELKLDGKRGIQAISHATKRDAAKSRKQDAAKTSKEERKGK